MPLDLHMLQFARDHLREAQNCLRQESTLLYNRTGALIMALDIRIKEIQRKKVEDK